MLNETIKALTFPTATVWLNSPQKVHIILCLCTGVLLMADGLQRSFDSGLNPARRKASLCPSGSRSHIRHSYSSPEDWGSGWQAQRGWWAGPSMAEEEQSQETTLPTWLLALMLSHSNCRARALYSHFLTPTQELGNLDLKIVTSI